MKSCISCKNWVQCNPETKIRTSMISLFDIVKTHCEYEIMCDEIFEAIGEGCILYIESNK